MDHLHLFSKIQEQDDYYPYIFFQILKLWTTKTILKLWFLTSAHNAKTLTPIVQQLANGVEIKLHKLWNVPSVKTL